jgi:two-component system sensor histidine kinase YesM
MAGRWYAGTSISLRMKLVNGALIACAVCALTVFGYFLFTNITIANVKELNTILLSEIRQKLDTRLSLLEKTLLNAAQDYRIQEFMGPADISDRDIYLFASEFISYHKYRVQTQLTSFDVDLISSFFFLNDRKDFIVSIQQPLTFKSVALGELERLDVFQRARRQPDRTLWSREVTINPVEVDRVKDLSMLDAQNRQLAVNQLMIVRYVTNRGNGRGIGFIGATVGLDKLANMLIFSSADSGAVLYVVDANRFVIASGDRAAILQTLQLDPGSNALLAGPAPAGVTAGRLDGKDMFIHFTSLETNPWRLLLVVPRSHYVRQVVLLRDIFLAACGAFLLLLLAAEGRLAGQIARPLETIVSRMNSIRAVRDIEKGFEIARRDGPREITVLADTFASLISRIESLNASIAEEGKVKRLAELRALQMQINPHFIYNALDSIRWLSLAGRKEETGTMIDGLSRFFRLGLGGGKETVRISHEIEHVRSYLEVQKIRFAERLTYIIDVAPEVLQHSILKVVLQPLVENSLTHGMKGRQGIFVKIQGVCADGTICLEVTDDGCGMDQHALDSLNRRLSEGPSARASSTGPASEDEHGYGLYNVDSRIRLHYGEGYGLRFTSREGVGTKVTLRIPAGD